MIPRKRILYVFDDINYANGVQKVTAMQIESLKEEYDISLFSLAKPLEHTRKLYSNLPVIGEEIWNAMQTFSCSFNIVMSSTEYTARQKIMRILYGLSLRVRPHYDVINSLINKQLKNKLNSFDIIIVLSESSKMRSVVASLEKPYKIQWIHTEYERWSQLNEWTRAISKNDRALYQRFDRVVTLSNSNRNSFLKVFPEFENKTAAIWNMIPVRTILEKSIQPMPNLKFYSGINIITISRIDQEKSIDRLLRVCKRLKFEGYKFHWYLVGGGNLYDNIKRQLIKLQLDDTVILTGILDNPMPLLKKCDLLALLSKYEGMPVTIHEAMILGVPVIATNVGGVSEQIENGVNGMILENNEESVFKGLKTLLDKPSLLFSFREQLKSYRYDNESILRQIKMLLDHPDIEVDQ